MKNKLMNYALLVSMLMSLANCAEKNPPLDTPAYKQDVSYGSSSSNGTGIASTPNFTVGNVPAGMLADCKGLDPVSIKSLGPDTIRWLATIQPHGLTLHENYLVARQQGYNGAFGNGQHIAYQAQYPDHRIRFEAAIRTMANTTIAGFGSLVQHHLIRRGAGYQGLFLCGGDACYQQGKCDNLGRAL